MKICTRGLSVLLTALCGLVFCTRLSGQTYHRYIHPEDLGTDILYADSTLTSITFPKGTGSVANNPKFQLAAINLLQVLADSSKEVMQIYVCGSTSPEGSYEENIKLSQARTDTTAKYLMDVLDVPAYMIHKESLNEDWDRLYELVANSDSPYKYSVMTLIKSKDSDERKKALMDLDGGKVWKMLEEEYFPKLHCVRIAAFCKWDSSKPYLTAPKHEYTKSAIQVRHDTVYVTQPVYITDTVYIRQQVRVKKPTASIKTIKMPSTPNKKKADSLMMSVKTNLLADAMVIPSLGYEIQLTDKLSLDIQGWFTNYNVFVPSDENTNVYGFSPEIRWWAGAQPMKKGSFFGIHSRFAWYTLQWTDGHLYQNGAELEYGSNAGNSTPAWSIGLTYGYLLSLDKKDKWGLEFVLGLGYGKYRQNIGAWSAEDSKWYINEYQNNTHVGITRAGLNLTYRFSTRRVKP